MKQIKTKSLLKAIFLFVKYRKKYEDCAIISCPGENCMIYFVECSNSSPCTSSGVNLTYIPEGGAIYGDLS